MSRDPANVTAFPAREEGSGEATSASALGSGALFGICGAYAAILAVGLVGNGILLKVFFRIRAMQTVPNVFLASLALGDLLLLLTCVPVEVTGYVSDVWLFGRSGCKVLSFIQRTSVGVSVFTLMVLSADRYKAIARPLELQGASALRKTCAKAAGVWIVSMLLAVPEAISSDLYAFQLPDSGGNSSLETCAPYPVSERTAQEAHSLAGFLLFYLVPLAVISGYYIRIAKTLYQSAAHMPAEGQGHARKQIESRKRVAKTVLVLAGLFAGCWLPNHVLYLYRSFTYHVTLDTSDAHLAATTCARVLAFANSGVNPLALYWLSKSFRQYCRKEALCWRPSGDHPSQSGKDAGKSGGAHGRAASLTGSEISVTRLTDCSITKEEEESV